MTAVSLSLTGLTDVSITPANLTSGDSIVWNGTQWTRTSQQFITSTPEITQNDSKAEVIGVGSDDGEFKVTLQDSTSGGSGATALRVHTDSAVNVIEFNEGNPAAKSRLVLNHLTTTNAWSEIHFKRTGASTGTSIIRSGGGGSGGYIQFYPVDGNMDFQVSGTGTYTRLNHIVNGTLTAGGLTYPTTNGTSGDVLTSDGSGNVTWQAPTGGGGGGANVTVSDSIPAGTPNAGDLWWESDSGRLKIYYQDVDSSQWVDTNPALAPSFALADLSVTTASAGTAALSYNNGTGVFTYTPPDLSSFITQQYTLPTASTTVLGGVKVDGSTINIDGNGVISGSSSYTLPTASTTVLGGVKVDGSTITIDGNGVISGASSVPTSITVTDQSSDTTCFPLFVQTATGNLTPHTTTALKLDSSSGELEASSFKKTGGVATEFLKADGSVDSTSYSTFSGNYQNLTNRPTIPTLTSQLTNDSGFVTSGAPTRVWILDADDVSSSGSNWGSTKLVTGIPTGGAGGTTPYKRITILFAGLAITNPGSGQIRIRLGTNNGIDSSNYISASTDGQGNTYTDSTGFIIGKTVSRGAAPLLSGSIVLDRNGGGASGGSFGEIIQTHTIIEHGSGTDHIYSGGGIKQIFQADNFDRLEFSIDNSQTGGNNVNLTGSFFFGDVSIYVEY